MTPADIIEMCRVLAEDHWRRGITPERARSDYRELSKKLQCDEIAKTLTKMPESYRLDTA